ncbi:MAG: Gfo/Idh/MocA family oxidoreductase [Methylococcaceae bacterium]|jgi:predicted dehydrogenase
MNKPLTLRWGILGAARINERLLPAIVEAQNAELIAIASRRPGAAAQTLGQYAPENTEAIAYDKMEALLEDTNIDAVYLPMANQEHAVWALRAIEQGKHVLCEKPMALTVSDIEAIESAASKQKVKVMEGFMYRFHPQFARVQELLASGIIGDVCSVRASYSFMLRPARLYRLAEPIERGGGAMWDIGCYAIHTIRQFFNHKPIAVNAFAKHTENGADTACSGVLDFGDGKFGHFDFSFERARRSEYEIIGTKGGLKCHVVWQLPNDVPVISWWTEAGQQCEERLPQANHFRLEIEHFSDCVLNNKTPLLTFADAKSNCRTIMAVLDSVAKNQTIPI